ncbi:hypothetical protein PsorP6_005730 [Peronosclerospora sorghi]|uniref:Uncharacterized protein n=1 Tax=Peronosclerospora sorghi TaxID=230839 RepID=A0ACC0W599_9STRA|nr:hypothetical protein PsorP6_005730 [Peronosclerospora sorghi]
MTVVEKLSKRAKYAPTHTTADATNTTKISSTLYDRETKFTSTFWTSLMTIMGVKLSMTSAHRPQADG